jgi:hypothetical protein
MATLTTRGIQDVSDMAGRPLHLFSSRFGQLAEDTVTLVHNVVPYAFWNAGLQGEPGAPDARGPARTRRPRSMIANARLDANKAIFQNHTAAEAMLKGIRKVLDMPTAKITGGKYGVGTATIPFAKVPGASGYGRRHLDAAGICALRLGTIPADVYQGRRIPSEGLCGRFHQRRRSEPDPWWPPATGWRSWA